MTPSLNRSEFIDDAIQSVMCQSEHLSEHIVVDGGSTDGTLEKLTRHPKVRVIHNPGQDSHAAMNDGIAAATGDIIGFLNTDDLYDQETFSEVAEMFGRQPELDCVCVPTFLFVPTEAAPANICGQIVHFEDREIALVQFIHGTPGFNGHFFRRRVFDVVGGFNDALHFAGDREFLVRCHRFGVTRKLATGGGYYYAQHAGSKTLDDAGLNAKGILSDHIEIARSFLRDTELEDSLRRRVRQWHAYDSMRLAIQFARTGQFGASARAMMVGLKVDTWMVARLSSARRQVRLLRSNSKRSVA